jgi:hypothetical protein
MNKQKKGPREYCDPLKVNRVDHASYVITSQDQRQSSINFKGEEQRGNNASEWGVAETNGLQYPILARIILGNIDDLRNLNLKLIDGSSSSSELEVPVF